MKYLIELRNDDEEYEYIEMHNVPSCSLFEIANIIYENMPESFDLNDILVCHDDEMFCEDDDLDDSTEENDNDEDI